MENNLKFKYKMETIKYEYDNVYDIEIEGENESKGYNTITVSKKDRNGEIKKVIYGTLEETKEYVKRNPEKLVRILERLLNE